MPAYSPIKERFWKKVKKTKKCWEWTAYSNLQGYGMIKAEGLNRPQLSHRVSWEMHKGPIPKNFCVLHKCDNPKCVRPSHLFLGTILDNNRDMQAKGRARGGILLGELANSAKMTEAGILKMRSKYKFGQSKKAAEEFGISHTSAWRIITRKTWRHI